MSSLSPPGSCAFRMTETLHHRNLAEALRKAGFGNTVAIPGAIVPIGQPPLIFALPFANVVFTVKFNDPSTRLECDINVNNQLGFINTSMIKQYVTIQPILIPLLRLIKQWAKRVGMNSPSKWPMSFSSYALTLMTIAWFQVRLLARSSDLRWLTSAQVIGMATESPGGRVRRERCASGPLLDKG